MRNGLYNNLIGCNPQTSPNGSICITKGSASESEMPRTSIEPHVEHTIP